MKILRQLVVKIPNRDAILDKSCKVDGILNPVILFLDRILKSRKHTARNGEMGVV